MNNKAFAVIGCRHAHIGLFIREMLALGYRCAGICEPDESPVAAALADSFGVPLTDNPERLLTPEVGVVGCAAVNNEKIDVIEMCEKHGKPVMLDKPLVTSREGLGRLEGVIARGSIEVGMLLTSRDSRSIYTLKQTIDEGRLGKIVSITMRKPHRLSPAAREPWHFAKEQNGGPIVDLLIHDFDLLRWLTDREIAGMNGMMAKNVLPEYPDFYDTAAVQVRMEGNILAQLYTDWHTPETCWAFGDCRIFVSGTEGCAELRLYGDPSVAMEELMFVQTNSEKLHRVELQSPAVTVIEDFLNRIEGKPYRISHQDLLLASRAAIEADEQALRIRSI
ncbi:Gfo/Idh/MocA family protein [Paenibacillus humicola]|uniref:Gfo/Idh/MocA family protein n=1 Tax=Paenibacillus humicola TaxID=3110540 RepID=UPI00237B3BD5|nr:Gfo/Idh/MocA family oxidoreductase [Paenibacillus humicola]